MSKHGRFFVVPTAVFRINGGGAEGSIGQEGEAIQGKEWPRVRYQQALAWRQEAIASAPGVSGRFSLIQSRMPYLTL